MRVPEILAGLKKEARSERRLAVDGRRSRGNLHQQGWCRRTRDRPPATARKLTGFAATLVTWDLVQFVEELSGINSGRAYYSSLDNLGNDIFADYAKNRRRNVR